MCINALGGNQNANLTLPSAGLSTRSFSILARLRTTASDGAGVGARDNGSNILLWRNGTTFDMRVGGTDYTGAGTFALDTPYDYAITSGASSAKLYVDGKLLINGGVAGSGTLANLIVGADQQGGGSQNVEFEWLYLFDRELSALEVASVFARPWHVFPSKRRKKLISIGSGGDLIAYASGAGQASGSADLQAQVALAGIGVSVAGGVAQVGVAVPLSAAGISVAGGSANGVATVSINAVGLATAAGQAGLSASVLLQAAGAAQSAGNSTLAAQLNALASGAAQASGAANLTGGAPGALSASGGDVASGSAVLSVSVQLQATGSSQASGSANGVASAPGQLAASGGAQSSGSASVGVSVQLTAAGFVRAMGSGQFSMVIPLTAFGHAVAAGNATMAISDGSVVIAPGPARYRVKAAPRQRRIYEQRNYLVRK